VPLPRVNTRLAGLAFGVGRLVLGGVFLIRPEGSTRLLGLDAVTARRITWLARMAAARDVALGAGTVVSSWTGRDPALWLVGGAVSDAVDAVVIADAVRTRRLPAAKAGAMVVLAAAAAALGAAVAADGRRSRR